MSTVPAADIETARPRAFRHDAYRTYLIFDATDESLALIQEQAAAWLRTQKGWDADLSIDGFQTDEGRDLLALRHESAGARDFRMRLVEPNSQTGTWRTELTVNVARREGWFLLEVSNDQGRFVAVPKLAKYLIQTLEARDGADLRISESPTVVHAGGVEELAAIVSDPDRNGLVFVAGTNDQLPFDPFVAQVARWTHQILGQAETFVLDPMATDEFMTIMGPLYGTHPWTLRTYRPGVDMALDDAARYHRYLTTETLSRASDGEITRILGRIARAHAIHRTLSPQTLRVTRALARVENTLVVDTVSGTPTGTEVEEAVQPVQTAEAGDELTVLRAQLAFVKDVLGVEVLDRSSLGKLAQHAAAREPAALERVSLQLSTMQDQIESLQEENNALREQLEEEQFEHALTDEERTSLEDEGRWLRARLKRAKDYEAASCPTPTDESTHYPPTYLAVLSRLSELEALGVVFTGDADLCRDLDAVDTLGKTTRTAWEALLVLCDYIQARTAGDWSQGVDGYLANTPPGYRPMSKRKHGVTETAVTMARYANERMFPVPIDLDPSGKTVMKAHFKLGRIGMVSPRMYYLDDLARTGKVYVGYIGPHLTNTQTS